MSEEFTEREAMELPGQGHYQMEFGNEEKERSKRA